MKKIKNSLTAKIFLLTACLLLAVSTITYACVARFLPVTYKNQLEEELAEEAKKMIGQLEKCKSVKEAEGFLEQFAAKNQADVTMLDADGNMVYPEFNLAMEYSEVLEGDSTDTWSEGTMTEEDVQVQSDDGVEEYDTSEQVTDAQDSFWPDMEGQFSSGEHSMLKRYTVEIGSETYTLLITGNMQAVSQTMEVLWQILPVITAIIVCAALFSAFAASVYLTKPIRNLSRISKKMASFHFDEKCTVKRTDEVGVLAKSINELSDNLSFALDELKTANARLKSDMEKEQEEERKRTAFFAAASHELKTPVTILKGHLGGMIQNIGAYVNRDYYLKRSYEVTETMEDMVKEILTVSRMESGTWEAVKKRVDLAELVRLQTAEVLELLEEKKMQLEMEVPEHLYAFADASMMIKVFRNLLINAIRYSPKSARIHIFMQEQRDNLLFYMANTGVQIPEEALPQLFNAFYRVETSRNRKSGGSGLGLYIVRMILEAHHGVYGASNCRNGVRIWFRLPIDEKTSDISKNT